MASTGKATSHIYSNLDLGSSGNGSDLKVYGDTADKYLFWDASDNALEFVDVNLVLGTLSSTSQTGIPLSATQTGALEVYADDNNTTLGNAVYGTLRARTMLFKDAAGISLFSVRGQLKAAAGVDFGTGVYAPVQGYIELMGNTSATASGKLSCFDAVIEIPSTFTLTSTGTAAQVAGIRLELTGAGSVTEASNGTISAVLIDSTASTAVWPVGVRIKGSDTTTGIDIGAATTGINFSGDMTTGINMTSSLSATDAILIAGANADAIHISGAQTAYGVHISGACTTAGVFLDGTNKLMFDDSGMYIRASADGHLEIVSDDTITLSSPGAGGIVFAGETDWGTGATGYNIDGTGWDWATQTVAHVDSGALATACAASYNALTVTPASHSTASSFFGTWTELYLQATQDFANAANCAAVWGQIEAGATVTTTDVANCFTAAGYFNMIAGATFVIDAAHVVNGVRVQSEVATSGFSNSGRFAAFECLTKSGSQAWDYGLYVAGAEIGVGVALALTAGDTYSGVRSAVTCDAPSNAYGAAGYFDTTITGAQAAAFVYGLGSWVNIGIATSTAGYYICAQDNGVYENASTTLTNVRIVFGLRAEMIITDTDHLSFPFSLNTNNAAITAIFDVPTATSLADNGSAGEDYSAAGWVPLYRDNSGNMRYVRVYG